MDRLQRDNQSGFTIVELMVVLVILAVLFGIASINLGLPQSVGSLNSTVDTLVADLKSQQMLAMLGSTGGTSAAQPQGLLVQAHAYVLFAGSAYNAAGASNFTVDAADNTTLATDFSDDTVVFDKGSGEVANYDGSHRSITVQSGTQHRTLTLSALGAIDVQ